ncbi:haloacid dehalogenase (plasmid) [Nostoc cf. commune SO-36]|uniref:Haloacid dehalogenase n=1 Tax=Nostoc cf. commune SO-36 TaxID=449208 RepID=A0ABN6QBI2_NOSCO|nr:HAD family hydrolase [Nostoc commune]BDI20506.1 haloacid dehalogenase [Nostoc cf. commune SO-36]
MSPKGTIAFDILGTCFSLDKPRQALIELGAPAYTLELWFAQTLRDAFALSHAVHYQPLKQILAAELPRSLAAIGLETTEQQRSQVLDTFSHLELQTGALIAFDKLQSDGWRLIALTNGSEESTRKLLQQSNALPFFDGILSCDAIEKTKPHPDVYALAKQESEGEVWLVAAHAWDVMGAVLAGLQTVFITSAEKAYLGVYPQSTIVAADLGDAANQILQQVPNSLLLPT